jgi:hypothetical protein
VKTALTFFLVSEQILSSENFSRTNTFQHNAVRGFQGVTSSSEANVAKLEAALLLLNQYLDFQLFYVVPQRIKLSLKW